ncbi:GNAT family N-acetyltransferase [Roseibium sp. AS2]|uniref:GNAT family N-acetyltransferase n=1 Tax=Roseibium sp. AS2 TaxID=3135781 RepID=UPI00318127FE
MPLDTPGAGQHELVFLDPLDPDAPGVGWQALCDAAIDRNPFFSPGFLCPLLENMGRGSVRLVVVRDRVTGRWLVAAPVGRRRLGLALATSATWSTDYSPLGTPLIHPDAGEDALRCFFEACAGHGGVFAMSYLPLHSKSAQRLIAAVPGRTRVVARSARASHGSGGNGAAQLAAADSGKRRKEMRRLLRRLGDHGKTRFSSHQGADAIAAFEAFLHLEAGGWKGRTGTALLNAPQTAAFARGVVANMSRGDGVRIDQLRVGEELVAALVLFQDRGRVFSWKIAFDEAYARYSPGAQIALQAFRTNLASPGFTGADSLAVPGHTMIGPLWRGRMETGTLLYARGTFGGLLRTLCVADLKLKQAARRAARSLKRRLTG